ncbi:hypothetical protein Q1695_005755 [Nippostrongylus brasiliensis]|nr:hypothetical protein Q1695_005755 [Nippostrongylus brasiliensis]
MHKCTPAVHLHTNHTCAINTIIRPLKHLCQWWFGGYSEAPGPSMSLVSSELAVCYVTTSHSATVFLMATGGWSAVGESIELRTQMAGWLWQQQQQNSETDRSCGAQMAIAGQSSFLPFAPASRGFLTPSK